jgi:hypothetical protein
MVFTHDTTIDPKQIILKSSQGNKRNGSKNSSISFELNQTIVVPNNVDCFIQLQSFKFVNSFYNVNSTNNTFYYSRDTGSGLGDIYGINIPIGNYDINAFVDYLNTQLSGTITISSSMQTFKLTFTSTNTFILRNGANNCLKLMGFNLEDTAPTTTLHSINLFNLSGVQMLYIAIPSLNISAVTSKNGELNNVIQDINIESITGASQSFKNTTLSRYKVNNTLISNIVIDIFDEDNNLVDFNNTQYFLNLSLIFSYKMEYKPDRTLDLISGEAPEIDKPDEQK